MLSKKLFNAAITLLPFTVFALLGLAFKVVEPWIYPVITDFRITEIVRKDGWLILRGDAYRNRACDLLRIEAQGYLRGLEPITMQLTYKPDDQFTDKVFGNRTWGPWEIKMVDHPNLGSVSLTSIHDCGWSAVRTSLASVPATYIDLRKRPPLLGAE